MREYGENSFEKFYIGLLVLISIYWEQRYDRLQSLLAATELRRGRVLQAGCHQVEAAAMWPAALGALRRDSLFFVEAKSY